MYTQEVAQSLSAVFAELVHGASKRGDATILNSGDGGLVQSLAKLSARDASQRINDGATIAAHAQHLSHGLALMNRWASAGGNPLDDPSWDDAWSVAVVDDEQWLAIRAALASEAHRWLGILEQARAVTQFELRMVIASVGHIAYHLGAIRQLHKAVRGPTRGTFT